MFLKLKLFFTDKIIMTKYTDQNYLPIAHKKLQLETLHYLTYFDKRGSDYLYFSDYFLYSSVPFYRFKRIRACVTMYFSELLIRFVSQELNSNIIS